MEKIKILNSRVPNGGRSLTSAECKALRAHGVSCSTQYVVMRYAQGIDHGGPLYRPGRHGGHENTGHVLELNR